MKRTLTPDISPKKWSFKHSLLSGLPVNLIEILTLCGFDCCQRHLFGHQFWLGFRNHFRYNFWYHFGYRFRNHFGPYFGFRSSYFRPNFGPDFGPEFSFSQLTPCPPTSSNLWVQRWILNDLILNLMQSFGRHIWFQAQMVLHNVF